MVIRFHPHPRGRLRECGATQGEQFPAKFNRTGFRRNFVFDNEWRDTYYKTKQVEAYAVREDTDWIVITIVTHYF